MVGCYYGRTHVKRRGALLLRDLFYFAGLAGGDYQVGVGIGFGLGGHLRYQTDVNGVVGGQAVLLRFHAGRFRQAAVFEA